MTLRIGKHRVVAIGFFALALIFAGLAFASAGTPTDAAEDGMPSTSRDTGPGGVAARVTLTVDALGEHLGVNVDEEVPVETPAGADLSEGAAHVDEQVDTADVGVEAPVRVAADAAADLSLASADGSGDDGATVQSARVVETPRTVEAMAVAVGAAAAAGAAAWFWPTLREWGTRFLFIPLYARVARSRIFENGVRERIFETVKVEPGISASELAKRAGVSWGTTVYHLEVLEQNRILVSHKHGRYRRYYENGAAPAADRDAVAILRNGTSADVATSVAKHPGLTQKELARVAGLSPQALHWHAKRLLQAGIIRKEREGRVVRFYRC